MLVCDNQQEISWFTGILEGEGHCCRDSTKRAHIGITNTDIDIINGCIKLLSKFGLSYNLQRREFDSSKNRKPVYTLSIHSLNDCYTLIKYLGDSFQCRRSEFLDKLRLRSSTTTCDAPINSDLHWLVGISEAEGHLGLVIHHGQYYYPGYSIKNTNPKIIDKIVQTLYKFGLPYHVSGSSTGLPNQKECFQVAIRGMRRVQRFLRLVDGLWISHKYSNKAKLLDEFLTERFAKPQKEPYSARQHEIYRLLRVKI